MSIIQVLREQSHSQELACFISRTVDVVTCDSRCYEQNDNKRHGLECIVPECSVYCEPIDVANILSGDVQVTIIG